MSDPTMSTRPCRSCHAPVVWATTPAGKVMPVDPWPDNEGNVELTPQPPAAPFARVIGAAAAGRTDLHRPHHATCPDGDRWRRRRRRRPGPGRRQ